jgi:hypothetical protein
LVVWEGRPSGENEFLSKEGREFKDQVLGDWEMLGKTDSAVRCAVVRSSSEWMARKIVREFFVEWTITYATAYQIDEPPYTKTYHIGPQMFVRS